MRIFLTLLLAALFCSAAVFSENAASASTQGANTWIAQGLRPESGVVEGFYGRPWTEAERRMMLHFLGEHGMNLYVYAPKDDPYHREKWREPYPPQEMLALKRLAAEARTAGVELVFAVSPGLDQRFSGWAGEADEKAMLRKLESVHAMGVERFAIFFDDIEHKDGRAQALFVNRLNEELLTRRLTEKPLLVVPTEYFLQDMKTAGVAKSYTREFAAQLDDDIVVLFTGEGVVPEGISAEDMTEAERLYGRPLGIWWNYPVTDYLPGKLALGPVQGLDEAVAERAPVFLMNPMEKPYLSRIALATGAEWLSSPASYDAERADGSFLAKGGAWGKGRQGSGSSRKGISSLEACCQAVEGEASTGNSCRMPAAAPALRSICGVGGNVPRAGESAARRTLCTRDGALSKNQGCSNRAAKKGRTASLRAGARRFYREGEIVA